MKTLYRFHWDCDRMGEVWGVFVAREEEVKQALGKRVYFGEILGKHSEIQGTLCEEDLEVVSTDADFIQRAVLAGLVPVGHNPLSYIEEG